MIEGRIYKLVSSASDKVYVGSTTEDLSVRFAKHKTAYNRYKNGLFHYISAFDVCCYPDVEIELIEELQCNDKATLLRREGEIIKTMNTVNRNITGRGQREYYTDKRSEILQRNKEKVTCENCGAEVCRGALYLHRKARKCVSKSDSSESE
jgi:hypothetical protein